MSQEANDKQQNPQSQEELTIQDAFKTALDQLDDYNEVVIEDSINDIVINMEDGGDCRNLDSIIKGVIQDELIKINQ